MGFTVWIYVRLTVMNWSTKSWDSNGLTGVSLQNHKMLDLMWNYPIPHQIYAWIIFHCYMTISPIELPIKWLQGLLRMEVMSILCISHTDICLSLVGLFLLLLLEINFRIALVRFLITPNLHVTRGDEKKQPWEC